MIKDPDLALILARDSRLDELDRQFEELRENRAMLLRDLSKIYGVPLETITSPDTSNNWGMRNFEHTPPHLNEQNEE